jgi:ABC-type Fe3+ transport system permease subunit
MAARTSRRFALTLLLGLLAYADVVLVGLSVHYHGVSRSLAAEPDRSIDHAMQMESADASSFRYGVLAVVVSIALCGLGAYLVRRVRRIGTATRVQTSP